MTLEDINQKLECIVDQLRRITTRHGREQYETTLPSQQDHENTVCEYFLLPYNH